MQEFFFLPVTRYDTSLHTSSHSPSRVTIKTIFSEGPRLDGATQALATFGKPVVTMKLTRLQNVCASYIPNDSSRARQLRYRKPKTKFGKTAAEAEKLCVFFLPEKTSHSPLPLISRFTSLGKVF